MPAPQLNDKIKTRERPTYTDMIWEQLQDTKTEIRETRKELNQRMDRIEEELKATRQELNARIDKQEEKIERLADKIDDLHKEIKSSTGHISIANISTVGIALAVIYSIIK
ncbi:MAG: hypothetical protein IJP42_01400 [Selenomonadaceae bacterium]|nr:hypothetical protein [Selenomonadaceae bacterium]MBQ6757731.1 hypothetical protein [Selenomonadaceae bacterium]MBR0103888.1 hypothetical protein [Selenomonadaceae bacterium]